MARCRFSDRALKQMNDVRSWAGWALFAAGFVLALPGNLASAPGRWLMAQAGSINTDIDDLSDGLEASPVALALIGGRL